MRRSDDDGASPVASSVAGVTCGEEGSRELGISGGHGLGGLPQDDHGAGYRRLQRDQPPFRLMEAREAKTALKTSGTALALIVWSRRRKLGCGAGRSRAFAMRKAGPPSSPQVDALAVIIRER